MITEVDLTDRLKSITGLFLNALTERDTDFVADISVKTSSKMEINSGGRTFFLSYMLAIVIPKNFPVDLPKTYDCSKKVNKRFDHVNPGGSLCLATDIDLRLRLQQGDPLRKYFEIVVQYLTEFEYWSETGRYPVLPRSHGASGVVESYQELLKVDNLSIIRKLVKCIPVKSSYRNLQCPCGSGVKFKYCHYESLEAIGATGSIRKQIRADLETSLL